jgi:PAS domain S-box-containing protein
MSMNTAATGPVAKHVLLVEDDQGTVELVQRALKRSGFLVTAASGVQEGLRILASRESTEYMAMLLDYKLPDGEPWQLADAAQALSPPLPVIFVTAMSDEGVAIEAIRRGFADYVKKAAGFWNELPAVLDRVANLSRIKRRLDETSTLMRAVVEQSSDVGGVCNGRGELVYLSPVSQTLLGRSADQLLGRPWTEMIDIADRESLSDMLTEVGGLQSKPKTVRCCRQNGSSVWVEARLATLSANRSAEPMIVVTLHDVTAQLEHEEKMEQSLREKEVLLREIYHRVKNNLQVTQSLLKMQARSLPQNETRDAIEATVQRVHAMALVHERLYKMEDLARLSLADYLRDLFRGVVASSSVLPEQIELSLDVEEIPLSLDLAIPFGLLANELISNSMKHGFPDRRRGKIDISLRRVDGAVRMVVRDDGAGLSQGFNIAGSSSMGLKLAQSLANQLGGKLIFTSDHGCCVQTDLTRL